jgi:crotonobetainyl-CoA:carnitine CoA-transferase CaiB-like acyl-CoA transferase
MTDVGEHVEPGSGPLAGVRVIELSLWVAGPAACGIMANWGADVSKSSRRPATLSGRWLGAVGVRSEIPVSPFEVDNRCKRSVVLDLRDFDDYAALDRLLPTADVLVTRSGRCEQHPSRPASHIQVGD